MQKKLKETQKFVPYVTPHKTLKMFRKGKAIEAHRNTAKAG